GRAAAAGGGGGGGAAGRGAGPPPGRPPPPAGPELPDPAPPPAGTKQRILADVERISRLLLLPPFWRRRITRMILEARRTRRGRPVRVLDIGAGGGGPLFRLGAWVRADPLPVGLPGAGHAAAPVAAAHRR